MYLSWGVRLAWACGCRRLVDSPLVPGGPALRLVAHGPDGKGVLACLHAVLKDWPDLEARFQELHVMSTDR
jgi:hypothetical protein